jgi:hypothetical protein
MKIVFVKSLEEETTQRELELQRFGKQIACCESGAFEEETKAYSSLQ